jgi:hypothetical protein
MMMIVIPQQSKESAWEAKYFFFNPPNPRSIKIKIEDRRSKIKENPPLSAQSAQSVFYPSIED